MSKSPAHLPCALLLHIHPSPLVGTGWRCVSWTVSDLIPWACGHSTLSGSEARPSWNQPMPTVSVCSRHGHGQAAAGTCAATRLVRLCDRPCFVAAAAQAPRVGLTVRSQTCCLLHPATVSPSQHAKRSFSCGCSYDCSTKIFRSTQHARQQNNCG